MGNALLCVSDKSKMPRCMRWNEYINRSVPSGETLLTIAAADGDVELANRLIYAGADVNHPNQNGTAPLHVAIRQRNLSVVDVLLTSGANVDIRDRSGLTPLHWRVLHAVLTWLRDYFVVVPIPRASWMAGSMYQHL